MIYLPIYFGVGLVLLISSYHDIRTKTINNHITFSALGIAILLRCLMATQANSIEPIISGFIGFMFGFIFGVLLYSLKLWGGADAKLMLGVGFGLGIEPFNLFFYFIGLAALMFSYKLFNRQQKNGSVAFVPFLTLAWFLLAFVDF